MNKRILISIFFLLILLVACEPESVEVEPTLAIPTRAEVVDPTPTEVVEIAIPQPVEVSPVPETVPEPEELATPVEVVEADEEAAEIAAEESTEGPIVLRVSHPLIWGGDEVLDPYAATRFGEYSLFVHERLVRLDGSGNLVSVLATAWESNGDGSVWTFTIRDGVNFHNGAEMGPADVAYSLERMIDPTIGSTMQPVLQSIASVQVDGNQVVIGLSEPNVEFPLLLTDERAVILQAEVNGQPSADEIGTGPFAFESMNIDGITRLVAHETYWGGRPEVDQVEIIAIPDDGTRIDAMLAGQIDILDNVTREQQAALADAGKFEFQSVPTGNWRGFAMRTDTAPFDDLRVRQAIKLAADRQALVDTVLGGAGTVACDHPVWGGDSYFKPIECKQDIERAKSLLAEAGYPDGIDLVIRTSQLDPYWPMLLTAYQAQAEAAGIRLEIVEEPVETFWTNIWLVEPFITTSWNERPAPLILNEAWRSGAPWNETYWNREEFDALLDQAAGKSDLALRRASYWQMQEIISQEGGSFIPFHLNQIRVVSDCVTQVDPIAAEHVNFATISKSADCD